MSGVSGTLPKTGMTDEEGEHVLNLEKRESSVLVPTFNKQGNTKMYGSPKSYESKKDS